MSVTKRALICLAALAAASCTTDVVDLTSSAPKFDIHYDENSASLWVTVFPGLSAGQTLHVRVRNGGVGVLDCNTMLNELPRIDPKVVASDTFQGPGVTAEMFGQVMDDSWLEGEPTQQMLQAADGAQFTIDLCLMNGAEIVRQAEMDIQRALDADGTGKFDNYEGEAITSVTAYGKACVAELGEIPFFEPLGDGDYATYSCLDSTPIPTTDTDLATGEVRLPGNELRAIAENQRVCDNPQYIYSLCEPNAVTGVSNGPRVATRTNEQGSSWVLLCRKAKDAEGEYNDVAMIGHNPYTGKTCYFQNGLYRLTDGANVPHPADEVDSEISPQQSESLWSGLHGGLGSGIQCAKCHDADPFIHTPWIDGAVDHKGDPVIPRMGQFDGYAQGYNASPYSIVDLAGQGWTMPKHITSEEAAPCTKCHRMGDGRWANSWMRRMEGEELFWNRLHTDYGKQFEKMVWMPPEGTEGLDNATFPESEYGKAMDFIQDCAANPNNPGCVWEELPTEQLTDLGELPEIELEGAELATEALKILGARVKDPNDPRCTGEDGSCVSRRCAECHSVGKGGLKHWKDLTNKARNECKLKTDPDDMTPEDALAAVACLRARPEDPASVFAADKVGILTTGARYGYFRKLFQKAYGDGAWLQQFVAFKSRVNMPKGVYSPLSEFEHAVIVKWFEKGLANMDDVLEDPPAPTTCEPFVDSDFMQNHAEEMRFDGWGAVNKENGIRMYGCPLTGDGPCFADAEDRTEMWGHDETKGALKVVAKLGFRTSFWTRSSADGRFIGNGGGSVSGFSATITDLVRNLDIGVKASYDPGFFPDNSGFIYQGGGTGICSQSLLETEESIDFKEEGCIKGTNINLYQHVARGLNGGDYFVINSQFTSDSGRSATRDPKANFNADSTMKFSPMIFNGTTYEQLSAVIVDSPFEGDSVLSPSGKLVISRLAGGEDSGPLGYVIREVKAERFAGSDNYKITIDKTVARICASGAKANISFDERFMVTHHYHDGVADIYLYDMLTGAEHQVTTMEEGSFALFPHFRSDGWFYFLVRAGEEEFVIGSDLALKLLGA